MEEYDDEEQDFQMYTAVCGNVLDGFMLVGLWTDPKEAEAWLDKMGEEEYTIVNILDQHAIIAQMKEEATEEDI